MRAVVIDIPIDAKYGDEKSNLKIIQEVPKFIYGNLKNLYKRIVYSYYLREINVASFELPFGLFLIVFGTVRGLSAWAVSNKTGAPAPNGTISLSALLLIVGIQFLLGFINTDTSSMPRRVFDSKKGAI